MFLRATYTIREKLEKMDFVGESAKEDFLAWLEETAKEQETFRYLGSQTVESPICWLYNDEGKIEVWDGLLPMGDPGMIISNDADITWFFEEHLGVPMGDIHVNDCDVCENPGSWFKKDYGIYDDEVFLADETLAQFEEDEAVQPIEEEKPMSAFEVWFRTFIEEKDLPVEEWAIDHKEQVHIIDNYDMVEIVCDLPSANQKQIKEKLVAIDFMNGDVNKFLKYLAEGYIATMF